ncbi:hypothetical protein V492_00810, partial [Pseudogymnoascus sp. VKM F-4246]
MRAPSALAALVAAAAGVTAQQTAYGQWYSQCVPGGSPGPTASSGGSTPTVTGTAPGAKATLVGDNLWIRAVADPNFHKYLQSSPSNAAGVAVMDDASTAGQFTVTDGQLVLKVGSADLYGIVNSTVIGPNEGRLAVTFSTTKNAYGSFKFSGDALQWTVAGVTRPNESAWLVCAGQELFVNLGNYGYQTPEGCADQT